MSSDAAMMDGERKDAAAAAEAHAADPAKLADLAAWTEGANSPSEDDDADEMEDAPAAAASSSSSAAAAKPAKSAKSKSEFVPFPAWPADPLAPRTGDSKQTTLNFKAVGQAQSFEPFKLPDSFSEKAAPKKKSKDKSEGAAKSDKKDSKDSKDKERASKSKKKDESKKDESSPHKKKKERVEDPLDRISADKNASCPLESFQNLVSAVRGIPIAELQKAGRDADTNAYLCSLSPDVQVTHLHEIPYISHFTWLFAKPLYIRAVEPSRLEAMLLHPDDVLNESLCSELLSKLLYATRVSFPVKDSTFRKRLETMQQNQKVFHYNLLGEWMFWLMEMWIAIWKKKCEREALQSSKMNQDAEEGEGEEGEAAAAAATAAAAAGADGEPQPRKKRKYTRRVDKPEESESSEDEADGAEDEEEQGAYNLHLLPERKFIVNTEELCGNINPFAPPMRAAAAAADAMEDESNDNAAAASSSAAAASSAAASSSSAAVAASSTPAAPAPISSEGHKLFHETPLLFRATFLKVLCDFQLACNPAVINRLRKDLETKDLRTAPLGRDMHGKYYFFFGFADYRIYVQGTTEPVKLPKDAIELEEGKKERERKAADAAVLEALRAEVEAKAAAEAKNKQTKAKAKKAVKDLDDDAPLALVAQQQKQAEAAIVPISSLSSLVAPQAAASAASSSPSPAAASASSSSGPFPHGLPFPLKVHDSAPEPERRVFWTSPPPPPFALLTSSPAEIRTLLQRIKAMGDDRNDKLYVEVKSLLEELEAGRGRAEEAIEEKGKKKEPAAPKRVSDRLVTQELIREEAERIKAVKQVEDARQRNTRRNRWLDDVSTRTVAKLKRAVEKFLGIAREKTKKEDEEDAESKASVTDDEAPERRTTRGGGGSAKGVKKQRGGRVTRNRGRQSNGSMAESETESEAEVDSDDEGCYVCATVDAPDDGSNPILFCDKCDKQICLGCVPLERVPTGKFFCPACREANPKIR